MRRYAETRYALYFIATGYSLLIFWGVLASGLSARLRDIAERFSRFRFLTLLLYYALLSLVFLALEFPLTFSRGFWLEHAYGLSSQSFAAWLADVTKGRLVDVLITAPVFWLLFWLIQKSPGRWVFWFWGALIPVIAAGLFLQPLVIEPVFNTFTPLPPGPLRAHLQQLAVKAGIPHAPILVADESRRTNTANAYVTGIGSSARIVIWDTTLKQMPPDEISGIVGHEMGHYVLKHLYWGFAATVGGLLVALPLAGRLVESLLMRFGARWHLRGLTDPAAVPVFLLTLTLLAFLSAPLANAVTREMEHQADAYGLQITGNGPAMARAFVFFAEHDLSDPNPPPFIKFWLFSHPPLRERIDFVRGRKFALDRQ